MSYKRTGFLFSLLAITVSGLHADDLNYGISGNPGAVYSITGTGDLGKLMQIPETSGVRLGGLWIGDYNGILCGADGSRLTGNSLLILDFSVDLNKAFHWKGGYFGTEFLQFNGQQTNKDAGVVQGYNSLPGDPPLDRSELYQLWLRQSFADDKFILRIGKVVPTYHFNNVSKPVPIENPAVAIPSVTGLIYTPIFVNTTLDGAIGGFYNSVYGFVATIAPIKEAYVNIGSFDGNVARGVQTGLTGPHFNGYYFSIIETGYSWAGNKPGIAAIGGWYQSGKLKAGSQTEHGTGGIYSFGSKALWTRETKEGKNNGNISGFMQLGWNNSKTLQMNIFAGAGLTAFSLVPGRPNDSFGIGTAWSRLNSHLFERRSEVMFQAYYQAQLYRLVYFQPVLSYIPYPGSHPDKYNVVAMTARLTLLF